MRARRGGPAVEVEGADPLVWGGLMRLEPLRRGEGAGAEGGGEEEEEDGEAGSSAAWRCRWCFAGPGVKVAMRMSRAAARRAVSRVRRRVSRALWLSGRTGAWVTIWTCSSSRRVR